MSSSASSKSQCPLCFSHFSTSIIESHASKCRRESPENSTTQPLNKSKSPGPSPSPSPQPAKRAWSGFTMNPSPGSSPKAEKKPRLDDTQGQISKPKSNVPLAEAMRPKTLEEYLGQDTICEEKSIWRGLIERNQVPSMVLWGPPGCGKTSLANVIAQKCKNEAGNRTKFVKLSACTSNVAEVKEVVKIAKNDLKMFGRRTILFIDEVHRLTIIQGQNDF